MRRALPFLLIFLLLLFLPSALRYFNYYAPASDAYQPPEDYALGDVPALVPTPAFRNVDFSPAETRGQVLLDFGHDNDFSLDELSFLDGQLASRGYELVPYDGQDLARALRPVSAFVVITPLKGFSLDEIQAVSAFVDRGGRLLLVGDPSRFTSDVDEDEFGFISRISITDDQLPLNSLANAFGIIFSGDYLYNTLANEGNFRNIIVTGAGLSGAGFTEGLERVVLYGAHSVRVVAAGTPLLLADDDTWSSATDRPGGLAMGALSGDRTVLALGDVNFLVEPYATAYDNSAFIERVVDFLTDVERALVLDDFPYFFGESVDLVYTGAPDLGPDAFDEIIALQAAFRQTGRDLSLAASSSPDRDALYLGLYNQAEDVAALVEAAGITLVIDPPLPEATADEAGDDDVDPAEAAEPARRLLQGVLGNVQMSGTALLLLDEEDGARSLVVLAASGDGLEATVERLLRLVPRQAPDVLADCLRGERLALCPTDVPAEPVEAVLDTSGVPESEPEPEPDDEEPPDDDPDDLFDPADIGAVLQGTVALDETVSGTLAADEDHAWRFDEGPIGIDIRLQTDDPDLDLVLLVVDEAGETVDEADSGFSGDDEWLLDIEVPAGATYTIVVSDFYGEGGPYSLTVVESRPAEGVLIFADDDGDSQSGGFTGAETFQELLGDRLPVTVWSAAADGPLDLETLLRHEIIIWTSGDFRTDNVLDDPDTNALIDYLFFAESSRMLIAGATPAIFEPAELGRLEDVVVAAVDSPLLDNLTPGESFALLAALDAVLITEDGIGPDDVVLLTRGADSDDAGAPLALANAEPDRNARVALLAVPFDVMPEPLRVVLFANILAWLSE